MINILIQKYCPTLYQKIQSAQHVPNVEERLSALESAVADLALAGTSLEVDSSQ